MIDYSTPIGKVRNLIDDVDEADLRFSDVRLQTFLDGNNGNIKLAAADAQLTTAGNQVLLLKVLRLQKGELETDGARVAAELRAQSRELRKQATSVTTNGTQGVHRSRVRRTEAVWG